MDVWQFNSPQQVLEARIDWLTCTVKAGQQLGVLNSRATAIMSIREREGFKKRPWNYLGYTGETIDGCTWGTRKSDGLLRLSGDMAARYAPTAIVFADNISRLDVQVTLVDQNLRMNWARWVDNQIGLWPRVQSGELETRLIEKRPVGTTSYIGSRSSDRMLRCYDKHAESEGEYPLGSWRWEVEYKHLRAMGVARNLQLNSFKPQHCLDTVCKAYQSYNITMPTLCMPTGWRDAGVKHTSDDERRLQWLKTSVAPMIERLRESHTLETVAGALGLTDVYDTIEVLHSLLDKSEERNATLLEQQVAYTNQRVELPAATG